MKWPSYKSLAIVATVLLFIPELIFGLEQISNSSSSSLFSTALRTQRMYDTSLQSSIIRLIRELMLTPKVYENMVHSNNVADRRADSGRILFPGESQGRSSNILIAQPSRVASPPINPGLRARELSSRTIDVSDGIGDTSVVSVNSGARIITRGRPGKVERVPRPIIINGNSAAFNAPRYNRMLDGPAPTVGGAPAKMPQSSVIMSQPLRVLEGNRDSRGRSLKEIDVQGVRVIVGQRVPDDPEDKLFTWRNGRVIKGMFFPNDPSNSRPMNQEQSNDISNQNQHKPQLPPSALVISSPYSF